MAETQELVTLTDGQATLNTPPDTELTIHEVARWSGYSAMSLRRLDNAKKEGFPQAHHRVGSLDRLWFAREVAAIIEYKIKALDAHKKATSIIVKVRDARVKAAKKAAKSGKAS